VPIHMVGSIDRGFLTEEGTVALMELKTGKWLPTSFKIRGMRKEMAFYAMLLKKADHPHKDVTHWGWLFPAGDRLGEKGTSKHWDYEKINRRYFSSHETALENLIEAHILNHFPPDPTQGKCAHCSFMEDCPAWKEDGDKYWKQFRGRKK
jgi:RecB family exonuclease